MGSVPIVSTPREGGGRLLGSKFARYVPLASQNPNHYTCSFFFFFTIYRLNQSKSLLGKCHFCDSNLVTFCECISLLKLFEFKDLLN